MELTKIKAPAGIVLPFSYLENKTVVLELHDNSEVSFLDDNGNITSEFKVILNKKNHVLKHVSGDGKIPCTIELKITNNFPNCTLKE
jgi:hypothetical protein